MTAEALEGIEAEPGVAKPDPILVLDGLKRHFGGLAAVDVEHLEFQRGAITALIGPNGAGKTTLFNLLTGFDSPDEGTWALDGQDVTGMKAYQLARLGMVRTFQLTRVLSKMTLLDNMALAGTDQRGEDLLAAPFKGLWRKRENSVEARARELLELVGLRELVDDRAASLSGGQRKLLELARTLMVEPELVMLDEPMAGVNPALTESLLEHITGIRDAGRTVVFVEHDMDVVQRISDWVVVMASGSVLAEGPPGVVARNPEVIDAYLGVRSDRS
ncbi:MAG: ABC transporter ATP-binding protein [Microthrixaceae bacterium]